MSHLLAVITVTDFTRDSRFICTDVVPNALHVHSAELYLHSLKILQKEK
jgi:hypothetical protein